LRSFLHSPPRVGLRVQPEFAAAASSSATGPAAGPAVRVRDFDDSSSNSSSDDGADASMWAHPSASGGRFGSSLHHMRDDSLSSTSSSVLATPTGQHRLVMTMPPLSATRDQRRRQEDE
jgi:hypothetical protein